MKILELLPKGARQVRYIHPHYEYQEDDDGNIVDEYCVNENTCTDVWYDIINKVHKNKTPIYYRRRTNDLAKDDFRRYFYDIQSNNFNCDTWNEHCRPVRVRRLGRRVIFIHDENHMKNLWLKNKKKKEITKKINNDKLKTLFKVQPELKEVDLATLRNELNFENFERDIVEGTIERDIVEGSIERLSTPSYHREIDSGLHYREETEDEYNSQ